MRGLFEGDAAAAREADPRRARHVLTVSELNALARGLLEDHLSSVWVEGEISNLKRYPSGHTYFTLKDADAQIAAVLFRGNAAAVRFRLEDGLLVLARGRVSLYETRGAYQIVVEALEPAGLGALQLAFEQLKARLAAEGLFDPARRRPLPQLPRRVGIVASASGAALRDILHVLARRFANLEVVIAPSRVQGDGAAGEIVAAIALLNRLPGVDVLIVARGGGSLEDLQPFNQETVARAIVASAIPVISAVGHETDVTIADLVADLRAPTPSAAAEMVVRTRADLSERIAALNARLASAAFIVVSRLRHDLADCGAERALDLVRRALREHALRLDDRGARLGHLSERAVRVAAHRLALLAERMRPRRLSERIDARRAGLAAARHRLTTAGGARLARGRHEIGACARRLEALSPLAVLGRGYAICRTDPGGELVKDSASVAPGDAVRVRLHRGSLRCAVGEVEHGGPEKER